MSLLARGCYRCSGPGRIKKIWLFIYIFFKKIYRGINLRYVYAVVSFHVYGCGGGGVAAAGLVLPEKKALGVKSALFSILVSYVILGLTADGSCTYASQNKYFGTIRTKKKKFVCLPKFFSRLLFQSLRFGWRSSRPYTEEKLRISRVYFWSLRFAPAVPSLAPKKSMFDIPCQFNCSSLVCVSFLLYCTI